MYNLIITVYIYVGKIRHCVKWASAPPKNCLAVPYTEDFAAAGLACVFFVIQILVSVPLLWWTWT